MANGVLPANLFAQKRGMSNALVVSGQYTDTGNPVAVFGPQTGYFAPQLLMLEEIQAPGISARGAAFAGLNFYVELGRGADYSWSATSAGQDIIDTFAVTLCNTDGSPATKDSNAYLYNGVCTPMQQIERDDSWSPTDRRQHGGRVVQAHRVPHELRHRAGARHGRRQTGRLHRAALDLPCTRSTPSSGSRCSTTRAW